MTDFEPFTRRLGLGQGRVLSAVGADTWTFVLGNGQPGRDAELTVGDHAEVVQDADLNGVTLVRARVTLRVPPRLVWQASLTFDGVKRAIATGRAGRTRPLTDPAANVSKLSGVHRVGVRLEIVSA